jgi:hypothetical protein
MLVIRNTFLLKTLKSAKGYKLFPTAIKQETEGRKETR